jgi:hypothetical protein
MMCTHNKAAGLALCLISLLGCTDREVSVASSKTEATPGHTYPIIVPPEVPRVSLRLERLPVVRDKRYAQFTLTNDSSSPIWYQGFSACQPVHLRKRWTGTWWESDGPEFPCATGISLYPLQSGRAFGFAVPLGDDERPLTVGVTLGMGEDSQRVWSMPANCHGKP